MRLVFVALGRAIVSQLQFRMLLLTVLPFLLSVALWGVLLWLGLQPTIDWLQAWFTEHGGFTVAGDVLGWAGLGAFKAVLVPLLAMWVFLPLMILTSLVFVGTIAMPVILRHVAAKYYPGLAWHRGGSLLGSLWVALSSFFIFVVLWLVTLPLSLFPPLTLIVQPALWGWLTYRVMAYDALAEHASGEERRAVMREHRWPLFLIGVATGAMGAAPSLLWLGGALSVIFFPFLATGSIWLYVLVFVFTGLWFEHYCLAALADHRARTPSSTVNPELPRG
jgi:hypothetical protein